MAQNFPDSVPHETFLKPMDVKSMAKNCPHSESRSEPFLKPMDIKRMARVPYATVVEWLTVGHPRAGVLPSIDLAGTGRRHSYRIRPEDWKAFLARLQTSPRVRLPASPLPRPATDQDHGQGQGMFRY